MSGYKRLIGLGVALVGIDQILATILIARYPGIIHSQRYFHQLPLKLQWPLAWLVFLGVAWQLAADRRQWLPLSFLAAGITSNFLTWLRLGRVVDYLPTGLSYINAADLWIGIGCFYVLIVMVRN